MRTQEPTSTANEGSLCRRRRCATLTSFLGIRSTDQEHGGPGALHRPPPGRNRKACRCPQAVCRRICRYMTSLAIINILSDYVNVATMDGPDRRNSERVYSTLAWSKEGSPLQNQLKSKVYRGQYYPKPSMKLAPSPQVHLGRQDRARSTHLHSGRTSLERSFQIE
jgi:hypothetical protein